MVELVVAQRYATALFELAQEKDEIDKIEQDVLLVNKVLENEKNLMELLSNPQIPVSERKKISEEMFKDKISEDVLGLIDLTLQKKRQDILPQIFNDFLSRVNHYKGITIVHATVYSLLTEEQEDALVKKLQAVTKKTIQLKQEVDKTLMGGLILRIGDRIINNSVKGKMEELSKNLLSNGI